MAACWRPEEAAWGAWSRVSRTVPAMATAQPSHTRRPGRSPAKVDSVGVISDVTCIMCRMLSWAPHAPRLMDCVESKVLW